MVFSRPELFDEYARRQFATRKPSQNPFGVDEMPAAFDEFDVFTKVRVIARETVSRHVVSPLLTLTLWIDPRPSAAYSVGNDKPFPDPRKDGGTAGHGPGFMGRYKYLMSLHRSVIKLMVPRSEDRALWVGS